jgi:hypothetical protein
MGSCHHSQRRSRPVGILLLRCPRARAIDASPGAAPEVRLVGKQDSLPPNLETYRRYTQTACRWTRTEGVRLSQPPR